MRRRRKTRLRQLVGRVAPWLALALGIAAVVAVVVLVRIGSDRVESSSEYCASCHADQAGAEALPGHEETACQGCHPAPDEDRLRFVWAIVDPEVALPDHGALDEESCASCHSEDRVAWGALVRTEGHSTHAAERPDEEDADAIACVRCHGSSLHGEPSDEEGCLSCHEDVPLESEPRAESECVTCHVFGGASQDADVADWAPEDQREQTWADRVPVSAVHGAADCRLCHNPHEPEESLELDCTECHRGNIRASAALGPEQHGSCNGCHAVHASRDQLPTLCVNCHARPGDIEETVEATRLGDSEVDGGVPVGDGGTEVAEPGLEGLPASATTVFTSTAPVSLSELEGRTHDGRCPTCHTPHAFVARTNVCYGCHEHQDKVASLAALPEGVHDRCVGCHEPHEPPPTRDACLECHQQPLGRGVPNRHRDCLSCHQPHGQRPRFPEACTAQCHEGPRRSLRSGPARHRNCASCHTPHGDPDARSANACRGCHEPQAAALRRGRHQECTSCHAPHSFAREAASARCGACHSEPTAPNAAHRGDCASCHAIHGGTSRADNCANCHDDIRPSVRQHRCNGCHRPHRAAATATSQCGDCHRPVIRAARTWPSDSPHAGRCMECHERHAVQNKAECGSCHREQANRGHVGAHPNCTGCHDPHEAAPANTAGWWNGCGGCHERQGRLAASAGRPEHRSCQNCHDRPGRLAPTCPTCHTDMPQRGLHAVAEHRDCSTCHPTHGTREPRPPQCRSCHDDRADHFPQARQCQACHIFTLQ